ncbi:hypothetical protein LEP1GSC187_0585 [Leptospira santarosai str. ZUN179]|uniref:Uncharacterized protein n=1 Tax=Leptospira santarosai str. ZUN179 TaxID=1049985 RepID=M6UQJ9_9LEPT|nr:hypothetical protein LEP1GSC187_0585 [Leptospira santarosai str. ZUN179]
MMDFQSLRIFVYSVVLSLQIEYGTIHFESNLRFEAEF